MAIERPPSKQSTKIHPSPVQSRVNVAGVGPTQSEYLCTLGVIRANMLVYILKEIEGTPWDETFSMLSILKILFL